MKNLIFIIAFVLGVTFCSCGNSKSESTNDSVEVVTDSVVTDSVVTDTVVVDTVL